jgi:hypothetical protein
MENNQSDMDMFVRWKITDYRVRHRNGAQWGADKRETTRNLDWQCDGNNVGAKPALARYRTSREMKMWGEESSNG